MPTEYEVDSNHLTVELSQSIYKLYYAWHKPEKAEQWRAKLPQTEAEIERYCNTKMAQFSRENLYNHSTTRNPLIYLFPEKS
jgi:hypothetical protein